MAEFTILLFIFLAVQFICEGASPTDQDAYPQILEHPQNGYLARDNPATLSCQADGNPKPTITWYHNGRKVKTMDEDPYSQKMLIEGGKLFFLRVIHQKDKSDAGVYYCNATNRLGSAISRNATLEIAVLRDDFLQSPSNTSVSIGDKAKFSCRPPRGEPTPKVLWMKGRKFLTQSDRIQISDNGDLIISQVTLNDADNYKCVATNTAGERESAPARLTVLEKPSFRKAPVDQITMEGKAVHFPCEVVGDQPISVEWRKENGALKYGRVRVLKDNTLRIEKAEAEDAGLYVCMASNSVGTAEAVARLTVQFKPAFNVKPHDQVVGVRRTVTMHCSVIGIPQPTIIWSKTSYKPSGEKTLLFQNTASGRFSVGSDGTLRIERVQLGDAGQYECEAINGLGSAKALSRLDVKVNDTRPPPIIRIGPQNQNLPTGEVGFLHCEAYGDPKPQIWWLKDDRPITENSRIISLSSGTLQISDLHESDSGNYTCKASSETGETSQSATLLVFIKSNKNVTFHRTQDVKTFPGPPSKPTVVEVLTNSIKLSWQPNNNHGDSPVFAYIVEYFSHATSEGWVVASDSVPPTTTPGQPTIYTVTNLKPDTTYVFQVRAKNSHGIGVPSELSDPINTRFITDSSQQTKLTREQIQQSLQGIVVELTAVEPQPAAVEVRWKVHKMMEIIDKFVIEYREIWDLKSGQTGRMNSVTVSRTALSFTIQNLKSDQWYSICIKAYSQDIPTQCSQPMKVQPTEVTRQINFPSQHLSSPSHVVIHKTTDTSISVQWLPPDDATRGGIKSYEIFCLSNDNKHNCSKSLPANRTSYTLENLKEDQTYTVKIAARTNSGLGFWSKEYVIGPEKENLMKQPWFIGLLISIIGVTLWFALCIFVVWLCKKRKAMKKQKMQEMYSVPNYSKSDDSNRNSFNYYAKYGYSQKDVQNRAGGMTQMAPEFAQLLETKDMEMQQQHGQGPSVYNVPQMKTFYQKKDPVAPYATTTLINAGGSAVGGGGHSLQDHMFRPITQHSQQSGSGDSGCCKHECSGDSNTSHSNTGVPVDHADAMQSPTSDSGSHTTDENGFLLKKGKKPLKQITQPKQAMVNWAEFLPPPPEHPPPPSEMNMSQHSSGNSSTSQQYAEINCLNREMGARSPMSPMSKISSCSCPVPHNATPVSGWNMPAYSDTGCVRCCSPKYFENVHYPPNQYNVVQRTQSPRGQEWNNCPRGHDTWGQRTIACMNASRGTPTEFKCRTCHSDQEQGGPMPQLQNYKIVPPHCENDYQFLHESEQGPPGAYNMPSNYPGHCNVRGGEGVPCGDHTCQSSMNEPCSPVYHNNKMDVHPMNIGVDGYHRNADSPVSDNGPDYAGESTELETEDENSPKKEGENEGHDDCGNMSGVETWPSYTDQCNTEDSSEHSSCHSDSDEAFLNEADFASTVAKAAEMSGLMVVGSTVSDPNADKQVVRKQRRHHRARPTSPYSTDSNFSEVVRKPYPKSQRKKQLMDQGKWPNRKDSPTGSTIQQNQSKYSQHDSHVPSYNKPNFPNAVPQKACRPKFQAPPSVLKSEDSKDEGQDSGINVEPTSKEGLPGTLKV